MGRLERFSTRLRLALDGRLDYAYARTRRDGISSEKTPERCRERLSTDRNGCIVVNDRDMMVKKVNLEESRRVSGIYPSSALQRTCHFFFGR